MLLLFDIDGTLLIRAADAHARAMKAAIREVHRVDVPENGIVTAGRTDLAIMRAWLTLAGVDARQADDRMAQTCAAACVAYARLCDADLGGHVAPAVIPTLERLVDASHALGLVTGNLQPIARLKLRRAGLGQWFATCPGGFGSDDEDRAQLPGLARARAGRATGGPEAAAVPREQTVVIGDTPLDIACARADGVHCVAVTTGPHRGEELVGADVVIDDMHELPAALARLG